MLVKTAILLFSLFLSFAYAGTCSSLSRNNYSANSILTSTALNADFNQLITSNNAFDGGCVTDGTLEKSALNTSDFAALFNGIQQGCKVSYSSASTVSVGDCIMSLNGNLIRTTAANTVAFGCTGCASESASTYYYVAVKNDSTDTTLNLLITTDAPGEDGLDTNGHRVIAKFYNNSSSNIDTYSIDQWVVNEFVAQNTGTVTSSGITFSTTGTGIAKGSNHAVDRYVWNRVKNRVVMDIQYSQASAGTSGTGMYLVTLPNGLKFDTSEVNFQTSDYDGSNWMTYSQVGTCSASGVTTINAKVGVAVPYAADRVTCYFVDLATARAIGASNTGFGIADLKFTFHINAPIEGWD